VPPATESSGEIAICCGIVLTTGLVESVAAGGEPESTLAAWAS
jgi:hypothetical protein